ncbi:MAG: DMT family transporter [Clostridiales bacterium]|nr:DMT family transporter [Clostridiales bacterium]
MAKIKNIEFGAKISLFIATIVWGSSFFIVKDSLDTFPVFLMMGLKFTVAFITTFLLFFPVRTKFNLEYLWKGSIMGVLLFAANGTQTIGMITTTPGKSAFLTAIYCVLVPFIYWLVDGKKPDFYNITAGILCLYGIGLVSLNKNLTISVGDLYTLLCGLLYALHIVSVAKLSQSNDIRLLTVVQFGMTSLCSWICSFLWNEEFPSNVSFHMWLPILYLSLIATAGGFTLQNIGQKYTNPSSAAIILSLESVFGILFSVIFYGETITRRLFFGFTVIFMAVLLSETKLRFLKKLKP